MEKTLSAGRVDFGPLVDLLDWDAGEDVEDVGARESADVVIASLRLSIDETRNRDRATGVDLNAATRTRVGGCRSQCAGREKTLDRNEGADSEISAAVLPRSNRRFCSSEPTATRDGWHGGKKGGDRHARWLTWKNSTKRRNCQGCFLMGYR